jgi:acyl-CoA thioester hydrolase
VRQFDWPVRVYYEDTDAGGVVYHSNYLKYFERGRTEWLRALGYSQAALARDPGIVFTVVSLSIQYGSPARLDDLLTVRSGVREAGGASVLFEQRLLRADGSADDRPLATAEVKVACIGAATFRPCRLPESLRKELL